MDRISAARERLDAAKAVAAKAKEAGSPCRDCRFRTVLGMCGNPAYAKQSFEPSTGVYSEKFSVLVAEARSEDGLCGPEALLFEPLSIPTTIIRSAASGAWTGMLILTGVLVAVGLLLT